MKMQNGAQVTLLAQQCSCCAEPAVLAPREDLAGGLAVCPNTGQLYRPVGQRYVPTALPVVAEAGRPASVQIDLSRAGYA